MKSVKKTIANQDDSSDSKKDVNPKINIIQTKLMRYAMQPDDLKPLYLKIRISTKKAYKAYHGTDFSRVITNYLNYPIASFDFYFYEKDRYLYSLEFSSNFNTSYFSVSGPISGFTSSILDEFDTRYGEGFYNYENSELLSINDVFVNSRLPSHFYVKGNDPFIETHIKDLVDQDDNRSILKGIYAPLNYRNGYFYFICAENPETNGQWYMVFTNHKARVVIKDGLL